MNSNLSAVVQLQLTGPFNLAVGDPKGPPALRLALATLNGVTQSSKVIPPRPLGGLSAARLKVLGATGLVVFPAGSIVCALISAMLRSAMFAAIYTSIFVFLAAASTCVMWRGIAKVKWEVDAGYTTERNIAAENPQLWVFDFKTLKPIREPLVKTNVWGITQR